MRESVLQKQILDYCKAHKIYCLNMYGSGMTNKGVPDIILCLDGLFIAIECKVGSNTLQDAQVIHANKIIASGGSWICARSLEEVKQLIESKRR